MKMNIKDYIRREFNDVCGCTFRVDDPDYNDIYFMKYIIDLRLKKSDI